MKPGKALAKADRENKDKYLQAFLERRRTFTPMIYSAEKITGTEKLEEQRRIALHLRFKLKWEYSKMFGFLRARMPLAIVISNSLLLRVP